MDGEASKEGQGVRDKKLIGLIYIYDFKGIGTMLVCPTSYVNHV